MSLVCTLEADVSHLKKRLTEQFKRKGHRLFYYEIAILFGETRLKAKTQWKEGVSGLIGH
jgi:hypothetical protein